MKLFLSPHFDDETLFGSFTILKNPDITVCTCFVPRETTEQTVRMQETHQALYILGDPNWNVLSFLNPLFEKETSLEQLLDRLSVLDKEQWYEGVLAPMEEQGGNPDHNLLSLAADEIFSGRVTHYATYTWPGGRTVTDKPVPYEPHWVGLKHQALACHRSQMERASTAEHFINCIREYYE